MTGQTDWNDLHCSAGLDEVKRQFHAAMDSANDALQRKHHQGEIPADELPPMEAYTPDEAAPRDGSWVARLVRYLYEVPAGLDARLTPWAEGWEENIRRKYAHYLALAQELYDT